MVRTEVLNYIYEKKELKKYLREQPIWYRKLSRNPTLIDQFEMAAMDYYKRTIPHRVEKFSEAVQLASMMVHMFGHMKE